VKPGLPVPSMIWPLRMMTSSMMPPEARRQIVVGEPYGQQLGQTTALRLRAPAAVRLRRR
jgi:hypothetical protein